MPITKARLRISDYNENRKAKQAGRDRQVRVVSLSLTSMVDMFAVLVIFLLACTATVSQWIETGHNIQLPESKFSDTPPKAATLQIATDAIYGDDKAILPLSELTRGPISNAVIRNYLKALPKRDDFKDGYVNIVCDERVPFGVIKRIIASCQDAGFGNINLAVHPK